jgi:hypothetical protein
MWWNCRIESSSAKHPSPFEDGFVISFALLLPTVRGRNSKNPENPHSGGLLVLDSANVDESLRGYCSSSHFPLIRWKHLPTNAWTVTKYVLVLQLLRVCFDSSLTTCRITVQQTSIPVKSISSPICTPGYQSPFAYSGSFTPNISPHCNFYSVCS